MAAQAAYDSTAAAHSEAGAGAAGELHELRLLTSDMKQSSEEFMHTLFAHITQEIDTVESLMATSSSETEKKLKAIESKLVVVREAKQVMESLMAALHGN